MARRSAAKGRLWPSFFVWLTLLSVPVLAQQAVYRCGQQYTNAPAEPSRCERLPAHSVTVISGTQVQSTTGGGGAVQATGPTAQSRTDANEQKQRDDMARAIVSAELDKARQRHAQLQQQQQQAESSLAGGIPADPAKLAQQAQLKEAMDRAQRDIDSLQRELERRPASSTRP